jgi:hypothetical protein
MLVSEKKKSFFSEKRISYIKDNHQIWGWACNPNNHLHSAFYFGIVLGSAWRHGQVGSIDMHIFFILIF